MYDVKHLFVCLFAICISFWVRYLLRSLFHFLIRLFSYSWVLSILYIFWISFIRYIFYILSPSHCLSFSITDNIIHRAEVLSFSEAQLISYTFHGLCLGVVSQKALPNPKSSGFLLCYLLRVLEFCVLPFDLVFVNGVKFMPVLSFLHVDVQLSQHSLLSNLPFLHCILLLCQKSVDSVDVALF